MALSLRIRLESVETTFEFIKIVEKPLKHFNE